MPRVPLLLRSAALSVGFFLLVPAFGVGAETPSGSAAGTVSGTRTEGAIGTTNTTPITSSAGSPLWAKARAAHAEGRYREAEEALQKILRQKPERDRPAASLEEAAVLLIDAYLRQGKNDAARNAVGRFRKSFPGSPYLPRIAFYQGHVQLRSGNNPDAAQSFLLAVNGAPTAALYEASRSALLALLSAEGLPLREAEALEEGLADAKGRNRELLAALLLWRGEAALRRGDLVQGRNAFDRLLQNQPGHPDAGAWKKKRDEAVSRLGKTRNLLVLAPLTGEYADVGKSFKEGVSHAVDGRPGLGLRFHDTQGDPIAAVKALRKALGEEEFLAVLGPAMSDEALAAAVEMTSAAKGGGGGRARIPLVTPTATAQGIADLGAGLFQLNITTEALGRKIASHAARCLGLKEFAVLAPESEYGYQLARSFEATVRREGGKVVAMEFYDPLESDHARHFEAIRKAKARLDLDRKLFPGASFKSVAQDSLLSLDGLFIAAASGEEALMLASQTAYKKLKTQILGASGWNDKSILHGGNTAVLGTIFSVDFPLSGGAGPGGEAYRAFRQGFLARYGHEPDKVAALSFDAARLILEALSRKGEKEFAAHLDGLLEFEGVLGKMVFDPDRKANRNTALYRVERRGFKEVASCQEGE